MQELKKGRIPKRDEIPEEYKWNLKDLYPDDQEWEKDFKKLKKILPQMGEYRGKLGSSADSLLKALQLDEEISKLLEKVYVYARLHKDEDNKNTVYQGMVDRAQSLAVQVSSATAFIVPEILSVPEEKINSFLAENKELKVYRHFFDNLNRQRDHVLSEREEELLAQFGEVSQAPQNIFTMLNNADIRFPEIEDEEGNMVELTKGRYIQFLENRNRRVRKDAFDALYDTYERNINTIGASLNSSVKKDVFYARVRKYPSALAASLDDDNVPVKVYENLIAAVHASLKPLHRYVKLRKKMLRVDELHMYDLYVPIVEDIDIHLPYQEAVDLVIKGMKPLGDGYGKILQEGFASRWIDVYENLGKTGGAYSWGAYGTHPYVLLNYRETLDAVFTIAHEMGHALHTYFSNAAQPYIYAQYKIFVAEVASTVNENLLLQYLLKETKDRKMRMYLLNHHLEQFRATFYRQTMFAEFEKIIHEMVEAEEALTPEDFNSIYYDLNKLYYGEDIVVDEKIKYEWARIPHFYNAFYVYKYATGYAAATAIAQQVISKGEDMARRYIDFLSSGSSDYPIKLLQKTGVDMGSPETIQNAVRVFDSLVSEMEKLAEEK
jgi:oligoendopeptidase F